MKYYKHKTLINKIIQLDSSSELNEINEFQEMTTLETLKYNFNQLKQEKINNLNTFYYNLLNIKDNKLNKDYALSITHSQYGSITETYKWFGDTLPLCTLLFVNDQGQQMALRIRFEDAILLREMVMYKANEYRATKQQTLEILNAIEFVDEKSIDQLNQIDELKEIKATSKTVNVDKINFILIQ